MAKVRGGTLNGINHLTSYLVKLVCAQNFSNSILVFQLMLVFSPTLISGFITRRKDDRFRVKCSPVSTAF